MPRGILIPADQTKPLEVLELNGLKDMQSAVGGLIEAIDIERPDATIFVNEDGKLIGLDQNARATLVLWIHNSRFRGNDILVGDVIIVGQPDDEGDSQDVPAELVDLLLNTPCYAVQVTTLNDMHTWSGNQMRYSDWTDAYKAAASLAERWALVDQARVISAIAA
ncbi:hypothetical protein ABIB48_002646 [Arthrobacter sp. UYCu511]|uniref:DUF3846 domain-containing protein n=1 Tax=Arthrobacter sp. UYCu511 TaxID=3156337 RepID=UPI003391B353